MLDRGAAFAAWLAALEERHLADLQFAEVTRALRALSADYVQRRERVRHAALDGRGKRAAFALFYGPLHFMLVDRISRAVGLGDARVDHVLDLGCGTGAAGAALATVAGATSITGIDRHPWAVEEAAWTYRHFRLRPRTIRGDVLRVLDRGERHRRAVPHEQRAHAVVAAYTVNELTDEERSILLPRLLCHSSHRSILIVEPIARRLAPWWAAWTAAFEQAGGAAQEWRFADPLPERVRALDRAAGLDHREQTARTLWRPRSL